MATEEIKKVSLQFDVLARCSTCKARASILTLSHAQVKTPVFMPVGTKGTIKSLLPQQLEELGYKIILSNTYHLANQPGEDILLKAGGLHKFMNWKHGLLTDSGGFQMVSLLKLAEITEEGVKFKHPVDNSDMLLTPEKSIEVQNAIGADIIMQLDDVVHSKTTGPRVEEAMYRTIRWLDRCLIAHKRPESQCIFPIVQGGLDPNLRKKCAEELIKRDVRGFAIGGLSGGEEKSHFWKMVTLSTDILPNEKPRYLMGVGFPVDLVVCVSLGCDMFDCVYPTRTARFGVALVSSGKINLNHKKYEHDFDPIEVDCLCSTCKNYTRAYIHCIVTHTSLACSLITVHNLAYQMTLMTSIRESILKNEYPQFVCKFMIQQFPQKDYSQWVVDALASVNINLT